MFPVLLKFSSSHLEDFQIEKISGQATVADIISIHKLDYLVKKANEIGKFISYSVYFEKEIKRIISIRVDNNEFYFTIICWAWMIDRELKSKNLITFDFDFESFNPGNTFEVNSFLNLKDSQETFIQEQYIYLKERIADHLSERIRRYWEKNGLRYYLIKTTYKKDKLVIKSRENFGIDFTDQNDRRICLFVTLALSFVIFRSLLARIIIEETITMEEQKSQCSFATNNYDNASESYDRKFNSSVSQFGSTVSPGELLPLSIKAQQLAPYSAKVSKTLRTKEFWCEKVKPNYTLYQKKWFCISQSRGC